MTTEITYSDSRSWSLMTAATIVSVLLFILWLILVFSKWRYVLFNVCTTSYWLNDSSVFSLAIKSSTEIGRLYLHSLQYLMRYSCDEVDSYELISSSQRAKYFPRWRTHKFPFQAFLNGNVYQSTPTGHLLRYLASTAYDHIDVSQRYGSCGCGCYIVFIVYLSLTTEDIMNWANHFDFN